MRAFFARWRTMAVLPLVACFALVGPLPAAAVDSSEVERLLVELDLPVSPPETRDTAVELAAHAEAMATAVEAIARELDGTTWTFVRAFETIPWVTLEASPEARARLETLEVVLRIQASEARRLQDLEGAFLTRSSPLVQADDMWRLGYDGAGWAVAIIDTGVEANHPFLRGRVVSEACYTSGGACPNGRDSQVGPGAGRPCARSDGPACDHGTHVAGIAAGRGNTGSGVARGAGIIAIQVFQRVTCPPDVIPPCVSAYDDSILAGMEQVYRLRDEHEIAAVNLSLGSGKYTSVSACDAAAGPMKAIVDRLRSVGIATIAASGNGEPRVAQGFLQNVGYPDALSSPACISSVISVGATNLYDQPALFSNVAPFLDLLAPGMGVATGIESSVPGGRFGRTMGTSQAAPHVAGAFAVLTQANGGPAVDRLLEALEATGKPVRDSRVVTPRIQILDAFESLGTGRRSGIQVTPNGAHTLVSKDVASERWALTLNADDQTVTGNVFSAGDATPQFLWCNEIDRTSAADPDDVDIIYECFSAGECLDAVCAGANWTALGSVPLAASFFRPSSPVGGSASRPTDSVESAPAQVAQEGASSRLESTPDDKRTLVNKDVGSERWAITRNEIDGTVTGNVYREGGGEPTFLWCNPMGDDGVTGSADRVTSYECFSAGPCSREPCSPEAWASLGEVSLPESFFAR